VPWPSSIRPWRCRNWLGKYVKGYSHMPAHRQVHRLKIRGASDEQARHHSFLVEDALRTASFPSLPTTGLILIRASRPGTQPAAHQFRRTFPPHRCPGSFISGRCGSPPGARSTPLPRRSGSGTNWNRRSSARGSWPWVNCRAPGTGAGAAGVAAWQHPERLCASGTAGHRNLGKGHSGGGELRRGAAGSGDP